MASCARRAWAPHWRRQALHCDCGAEDAARRIGTRRVAGPLPGGTLKSRRMPFPDSPVAVDALRLSEARATQQASTVSACTTGCESTRGQWQPSHASVYSFWRIDDLAVDGEPHCVMKCCRISQPTRTTTAMPKMTSTQKACGVPKISYSPRQMSLSTANILPYWQRSQASAQRSGGGLAATFSLVQIV